MLTYIAPMIAFIAMALIHKIAPKKMRFKSAFATSLIGLTLVAGTRFQVGQDWEAYEAYFIALDKNSNHISEYFTEGYQQFEIGFLIFNLLLKQIWNNYAGVFLATSALLSTSLYLIISQKKINHFYTLSIYLSYSYLILNFAQVRQALALACMLIGVAIYLKTKSRLLPITVSAFGAVFQYSALMYTGLLAIALFAEFNRRTLITTFGIIGAMTYFLQEYFDVFSVLNLLSLTESTQTKIEIYKDNQNTQSSAQQLYIAYLFFLSLYFSTQLKYFKDTDETIIKLGILTTSLTVTFALLIPGSYVMYSRAYVAACIFHGIAFGVIEAKRNTPLTKAIFYASLTMALVLYARLLLLNESEYSPYNSVIF